MFTIVSVTTRGLAGKRSTFWKARNDTGAQCLHLHQSPAAAQRCADKCNRPTRLALATPQSAYDYAAGYHE